MLTEAPNVWPGLGKNLRWFDPFVGSMRWGKVLQLTLLPLFILFMLGPVVHLARTELNKPVTILLLGSDNRANNGPSRSDSIFLVRTDPEHGMIRGLSLPRDLYVPLKGLPLTTKQDRLNTALFWGEYYNKGQGMEAAKETITSLTRVPIDGIVLVRFNMVKKLVDALGGIEVYFEKPLADKKFNSLKGETSYALRFESGWNYLDGKRALEYIRIRKPDSDFGRQSRNRQLLTRVLAALQTEGNSVRLIPAVPSLWKEIEMELSLMDSIRFAWALRNNRSNGIQWDSIRKDQVMPTETPRGAKVLMAEPGVLEEAGKTLMGAPVHYANTPVSRL
jgi:LCP family protein required for cell wall assembly